MGRSDGNRVCISLCIAAPFLGDISRHDGTGAGLYRSSGICDHGAEIDNVYPMLIANLIPPGLQGLILVGILATVMSTVAAFLNSISTLFTYDVYKKWINPGADDQRLVRVGMW